METRRRLIQGTNAPELSSVIRRERFYKLSTQGLLAFIDENPSPYEFWIGLMWHCSLNPKLVDKAEFNRYYDIFIQKFVGSFFPLRSCFFSSDSFDGVFRKWRGTFANYQIPGTHAYHKHHETEQAYKVMKCLLQNRAVTIETITVLTQLTEQDIRKVLKDYSINQTNYYHYIDLYENYRSSRSIEVTIDYLNHLIIVPIREKGGKEEGKNDNKDQKYELSLLGILLMLATISLTRKTEQKFSPSSIIKDYDKIASNYKDKLPLIFGKWKLLKQVLDFDSFPSIFDYLFLSKSEILSLSVLLGGNKEIYDNIRSAALSTINKFFVVYDDCILALQSNDCPEEFPDSKHYQFGKAKLHQIERLLKYADLESFAKHMKNKQPKPTLPHVSLTFKDMPVWKVNKLFINNKEKDFKDGFKDGFKDDLRSIEDALADEFSLLFYIGLLRENNHKASDYPLSAGFLKPSPNLVYPKDLLMQVVRRDAELRKKLEEWMREATNYQKITLDKMNQIRL